MTATSNTHLPAPDAGTEPDSIESPARLSPRGLRVADAAAYASCTAWAIRFAIWCGKLKAKMIGRNLVIPREDLNPYLDALAYIEPNVAPKAGLRVAARQAVANGQVEGGRSLRFRGGSA